MSDLDNNDQPVSVDGAIGFDLKYAESESSLSAFTDLHFRIRADGTYVRVWALDPSLLHVPADEIAGTNISDHFPASLSRRMLDAITLAIATSAVTSVEYSLVEGEQTSHYEARIAPLGSDDVMAVVRDITSLKGLEQQLVHAETMQSVGRLAGGIAHDFNNVLHVIRGHVQALRRHRNDPAETDRRLDVITRAVDRTSSLVERLMILSRPTPNNPTPTNVDSFLRGLGPTLSQLSGETIELEFDLDASDCAVAIDDSRFENVLLNLASNALDAMPSGGAIRITTREGDDDSIVLEVSDTGDGIDADDASQIFEPFFTTKAVGIGTGLGLATTYGSITAAGGSITVDSEHGSGTVFTIVLPTTSDDPLPTPPPDDQVRRHRSATILVVEDEPDVLGLCVDALQDMGHQVLNALNASEALALIDGGTAVDLLLTDVVMPAMSGSELALEIAKRHGSLPVVFMTGYADAAERLLGSGDILRKPFTEGELADAVNARLANGAAQTEPTP